MADLSQQRSEGAGDQDNAVARALMLPQPGLDVRPHPWLYVSLGNPDKGGGRLLAQQRRRAHRPRAVASGIMPNRQRAHIGRWVAR